MEIYTFSQWVLFFYLYCFFGWIFESVYVSVCEKHWVNRGFLKGPILPIYGFGALCILVVTIPFRDNLPLMCLAGMVSATVLEYVTGAAMEKLFHVRYWDYTGRLLSVNGHICLASVLCWGVMTILVVDVLQVQLEKAVLAVDEQIVTVAVFAVTPFVTGDLVTSFRAAIRLRDVLVYLEHAQEELEQLAVRRRELEAALEERRQELETSLEERRQELERSVRESREHALAPIKDLTDKLAVLQEKTGRLTAESELLQKLHGRSIRGLLKRNPKAMSYSHREVFNDLKKRVAEKPEKTKKNLRK